MCLAFSRVANSCVESPLELLPSNLRQARSAYDASVCALVEYLGDDVPCGRVDIYLWRYFVDWYRFVHMTKPAEAFTRSAVLTWIAQQEKAPAAGHLTRTSGQHDK